MATYSVTNNNGHYTLRLTVTETGTDAVANTSTISWSLNLIANTSYYFSTVKVGRTVTLNGSVRLNIARADSASLNLPAYGTLNLGSGTGFVVAHNPDGSKSISIAYSIDTADLDYTPGDLSGTGTMTLTTLARQSTLGAIANFDVDGSVAIPITKYISSYTDSLVIKYGTTTIRTVAGITNGTVITFTSGEKTTIYGLMSTVKSGTFTFILTTKSGATTIGTSTKTATGEITNANPTLSATVVDVNSATIAKTGSNLKLIRYQSTARITITSAGAKGATIVSKVVNGTSVSGTTLDIANVATTPFTVTVTDSRGNSTSVILNPVVVEYIPMTLSASFARTTPTSGIIAVTFSGNFFNGSFGASSNAITLKWYYRIKDAASYTLGGAFTTPAQYTKTGNIYASVGAVNLGSSFDYTKAYDLKIQYADSLTSVDTGGFIVARGLPIADWGETDFNINGDFSVVGNCAFSGNVLKACCATGTDSSLTLTSNAITIVPLATLNPFNDSSVYSISDGGVKVAVAGNYMISGSVYITLTTAASTSIARGVYIFNGAAEINNALEYSYNSNNIAASIACGMKIVTLAANDILYLKARTMGTGGTAYPNKNGTYLTIVKI